MDFRLVFDNAKTEIMRGLGSFLYVVLVFRFSEWLIVEAE